MMNIYLYSLFKVHTKTFFPSFFSLLLATSHKCSLSDSLLPSFLLIYRVARWPNSQPKRSKTGRMGEAHSARFWVWPKKKNLAENRPNEKSLAVNWPNRIIDKKSGRKQAEFKNLSGFYENIFCCKRLQNFGGLRPHVINHDYSNQ